MLCVQSNSAYDIPWPPGFVKLLDGVRVYVPELNFFTALHLREA